ncbi:MAG TPA: hypothetical protein DCE56_35025, partial [Cyanobacteria bacterium UBA8553]|nr:hypothetical protein [Cyanobacteria bacterium UBA8553]
VTTPLTNIDAPSAGRFSCPTANNYCTFPRTSFYQVLCVDGNGDGKCTPEQFKDMIVQASGYQRTNVTPPPAPDNSKNFQLGICVYRADAFVDSEPLKVSTTTLRRGTTKAQARVVTGGLGDRKAPQIEMQTEIVTTNKPKYDDYVNRLNPSP